MGRKHTGAGQYIYVCIAFLICFVISGCVASDWRFFKTGDSQENQKNLLSNDEALFNTGLSYADPGNPVKDYDKSLTAFKRLVTEYPKSTWAYRGHIISEVLQESTKLKKQGADLSKENTKLKEIIEQSKKVDIEIEKKKRE
jgi:hypothetical protein